MTSLACSGYSVNAAVTNAYSSFKLRCKEYEYCKKVEGRGAVFSNFFLFFFFFFNNNNNIKKRSFSLKLVLRRMITVI